MVETFGPLLAISLVALIVGLSVGKLWSRRLLYASLTLFAVGFAAYAIGLNHSRTADDLYWLRGVSQSIATFSSMSLYSASGLFGPALAKPSAGTVLISAAATLIVLIPGTWMMFALACGLASDCI